MRAANAWEPSGEIVERANSTRLARSLGLDGFDELVAFSIAEPDRFWDHLVGRLELGFRTPYTAVSDRSRGAEWTRWFVGGELNVCWSCVDRHAEGPAAGREAIRAETEDGLVRTLSYAELAVEVARFAAGLRALGVEPEDRVALVMPMTPEIVIAFYAIARLGAVIVPIFSGFSAQAIAARLDDAEVSIVVCADAAPRRGRAVPIKQTVDAAAAAASSVRHVVVLRHLGVAVDWHEPRDVWWHELVEGRDAAEPCRFVDSEHPLMIAYTSGTTGRPKGAVHVHGGLLAKLAEEVHVQADLRPGDALFWLTDMGWIMGPWETIGTHANGGTLVLYDGAPGFPDPGRVWQLAARHRVAFLGVSPTLIRALAPHGATHAGRFDLSSLRAFGSTGEPWNPEPYRWLFEEVGGGARPIINISGGTEIGACLLSCDVAIRLEPCTLGRPALGMDVDVVDAAGRPVRDGGLGELVCRSPWPSMTRGLWGDPERYLDSYWRRLPGVWVHGDWASVAADGSWFLHGRSDDTLNVAGKRVGPAEYESLLVAHPAVVEACTVGVPHPVKGEAAHCFVVLAAGAEPTEELRGELLQRIEAGLGPAFRPARIAFVDGLPRTRSAKIVRRAVRAAVLGEDPGDLSTLEDPAALTAIRRAR